MDVTIKKAPGKNTRKGVSMIQAMRMFPDDAAAEQWFIHVRWPLGLQCPALRGRLQPRPVGRQAQDDAVPLPRLPQAVLGSHRNRHAGLEPGISGVGHGNLPVHDQPEIRVVHEAAP